MPGFGGQLDGIRIIEFEGLGPTPFAAMMLADLGADVIRIDRRTGPEVSAGNAALDALNRGRPSIALDLKDENDRAIALGLIDRADAMIEGNRPGVMERLGLGPETCLTRNPALVYARMTGWGQSGPLADKAGHDINYIAQAGVLHAMGPSDAPPPPPLNLVGDFGGGALFAVVGIVAALLRRTVTARGQVIDAAMIDGAALLATQLHAWRAMGFWHDARESNLLDGAAYFYRCYETADGGYLAIGAIEPQFHAAMLRGFGFDPAEFPDQFDRASWRPRRERLAARIATRTRDAWADIFAPIDACVTPVLSPAEAVIAPANVSRGLFGEMMGQAVPAPAPRFAGHPRSRLRAPDGRGASSADILARWGLDRA
ncbi:CaiB/BaiF CoA transferase family protein [Sphingomonas colocasiae]|uniref:CoA transferase n=1 Tax=Sphingomonas colocasiae TaxID=1848973 RepID=A0ABS7PJR0_9SPHN|nr:CaiB/BaiF CoA-transferase family protein [Sphingomonas colocasiae]MBY8821530.1 CoA transferase [Sphingomonas colocasiae]